MTSITLPGAPARRLARAALLALLLSGAAGAALAQEAPMPTSGAQSAPPPLTDAERDARLMKLEALVEEQAGEIASLKASNAQTAAKIDTIPAEVQTAVASMPKPAPKKSWADDTTVSGRMYYDLTDIQQDSNGVKQPAQGFSFDVKRFYVGVDHKFNDMFSGNVTTDFNYVAADGQTQVYIKKAYLQAKISDALVIRAGAADMPWVPFVEDLYGYRYVENVLIDRTKFGTSTDWGVHALGKFDGGLINYAVSVVNGAGYKVLQRSNGMDIEGRVNLNYDGFVLGVGGYTGKLGKEIEGTRIFHTADRFDVIGAYVDKRFRVGAEYFVATDWTAVTTPIADKAEGFGLFGAYNFTDQIGVFGRYDWVKPNKDTAHSLKDDYFNVGISYSPVKIVDFALVYKRDKAEDGIINTSNGKIGGSKDGTYDEIGLWGQFRY